MYVCLFSVFQRASCSLGQWSITLVVRGWGDEGFVCYSRERADLHYSAHMCAAQAPEHLRIHFNCKPLVIHTFFLK